MNHNLSIRFYSVNLNIITIQSKKGIFFFIYFYLDSNVFFKSIILFTMRLNFPNTFPNFNPLYF
jgi:hypothetical protein